MSNIVRLDEDVYSALKARTLKDGKSLSKAISALLHTLDCDPPAEKRLASLESKIDELSRQFARIASTASQTEEVIERIWDFLPPVKANASSKSTAESFIIDTWLVSCAASGSRFACASPGSVAAYHGALSRLRLGFKSRLGRFFFAFF